MSNSTGFLLAEGALGKPVTTIYTSGTGTYIPTADGARCRVTIIGGGGGGSSFNSTGYAAYSCGAGGGTTIETLRVPLVGLPYSVGAGGAGSSTTTAATGGTSYFGVLFAKGGMGGSYNLSATTLILGGYGASYLGGGMGGYYNGSSVIYGTQFSAVPTVLATQLGTNTGSLYYQITSFSLNAVSLSVRGGDTLMAIGPTANTTTSGTPGGNGTYGAGGAAGYNALGGNGGSGIIIIEDYGV